jgi:hypothetical protein
LLGAHVFQRSDQGAHTREDRIGRQLLGERLGDAEIDNLGRGAAIDLRDQNVRGFQVAVDDGFLMRVLDSVADVHEQLQPLAGAEAMIVAPGCDGHSCDVLHDKVGRARRGGAGIKHLGDGRVVHKGEGLALGLEAGDHFAAVQSGLHQFENDAPAHGFFLLGRPDLPHAAFPDLLQQVIAADQSARGFLGRQGLGDFRAAYFGGWRPGQGIAVLQPAN